MNTVRTVNTALAAAALLAATVAGCSHGSSAARAQGRKITTTNWYGPATPDAFAALDKVKIATPGRNCGGGPLDSGWPTTGLFGQPSTCLRDTDRAGHAAYMVYTGRTSENGAYRFVLATAGAHTMTVTAVTANQVGALRRDEWRCPVPTKPILMSVFFPAGHVQPAVVFDEHCPLTSK